MKRIRFTAVAALFLAAAMLLTSCAGSGSASTTAASTAASTTAAAGTTAGSTAASTTKTPEQTAAADSPVTAAGCLPIVNEMIELEVMMGVNNAVSDYVNNDMTRKM